MRLPKEQQEKIDYGIKQCQLAMNRCLRKIGWSKAKKNKKSKTDKKKNDALQDDNSTTNKSDSNDTSPTKDSEENNNTTDADDDDDDDDGELIKEMQDEDDWDALMNKSISDNLIFIAYFTSPLS